MADVDRSLDVVIAAIRALAARGELPRDLAEWKLTPSTEIDELGIDSMGTLALLSELEERADVALGESALAGVRTLADLGRVLVDAGMR
jgi:acyl carrier protein